MTQVKVDRAALDLPKDDSRIKLITAAMKKEGHRPDSLIQVLHTAQNLFGYLPLNIIQFIARSLRLPPSRVFGVVTFYHFFSLKPKGEHTCLVCTGTACYVKGAQQILDEVLKKFSLRPGEVTADNHLGLETARCIGSCGLAPAVVLDDKIVARVNPVELPELISVKIGAQS